MRSPWLLVFGDVVALGAFGILGVVSHEKSISVEIVTRSIVLFVVAWLLIGAGFRMFSDEARKGRVDPGQFLMAWVIAGFSAMVARGVIFDRTLFTAFFVIGLAGNGLFLAGWRLAYYRVVRTGASLSGPSAGTQIKEGTNG